MLDFSIGICECDTVEWKEVFSDQLLENAMQSLCAFLNSFGGKIIFGVNNNGMTNKLAGDLDLFQRRIYDQARNHIKPHAHSLFGVKIHDGLIYIFVTSDKSKIYQYKNVTYKRTGSSTHGLSYEETKELEKQRENHITEIAPGVFNRIVQGEYLKCKKCGYTVSIGLSVSTSVGSVPEKMKCPQCNSILEDYS